MRRNLEFRASRQGSAGGGADGDVQAGGCGWVASLRDFLSGTPFSQWDTGMEVQAGRGRQAFSK